MIKTLFCILIALSVNSCGGRILVPECDPFEAGGVTVCTLSEVSPEEVAETVQEVSFQASAYYPEAMMLEQTLASVDVWVYILDVGVLAENCRETGFDDLYTCEKALGGQNRNGVTIIVKYHPCLAWTSLAHELLHSFEMLILQVPDEQALNHSTPHLFGQFNVEWNVENTLYHRFESCR